MVEEFKDSSTKNNIYVLTYFKVLSNLYEFLIFYKYNNAVYADSQS